MRNQAEMLPGMAQRSASTHEVSRGCPKRVTDSPDLPCQASHHSEQCSTTPRDGREPCCVAQALGPPKSTHRSYAACATLERVRSSCLEVTKGANFSVRLCSERDEVSNAPDLPCRASHHFERCSTTPRDGREPCCVAQALGPTQPTSSSYANCTVGDVSLVGARPSPGRLDRVEQCRFRASA